MAFISDSSGIKSDEEEITLGLAYRPNQSQWIILERLDLPCTTKTATTWTTTACGSQPPARQLPDRRPQVADSFYYGLKYVRENFDGDRYDGYTDMLAVETRYNITTKWDVGAHAALLHS